MKTIKNHMVDRETLAMEQNPANICIRKEYALLPAEMQFDLPPEAQDSCTRRERRRYRRRRTPGGRHD